MLLIGALVFGGQHLNLVAVKASRNACHRLQVQKVAHDVQQMQAAADLDRQVQRIRSGLVVFKVDARDGRARLGKLGGDGGDGGTLVLTLTVFKSKTLGIPWNSREPKHRELVRSVL